MCDTLRYFFAPRQKLVDDPTGRKTGRSYVIKMSKEMKKKGNKEAFYKEIGAEVFKKHHFSFPISFERA